MKDITFSRFDGFYQLSGGAKGKAKVADLINKTSYIFLLFVRAIINVLLYLYGVQGDLLVCTTLLLSLAIISALHEFFFTGTCGTLAEKHEDHFKITSNYPENMKHC